MIFFVGVQIETPEQIDQVGFGLLPLATTRVPAQHEVFARPQHCAAVTVDVVAAQHVLVLALVATAVSAPHFDNLMRTAFFQTVIVFDADPLANKKLLLFSTHVCSSSLAAFKRFFIELVHADKQ